jgi:hypothetical protein
LVIGITKGSRIIYNARLKSAQSLTQSSPVVSTANLALWLETTLDKSFADNEKIANVAVSSWNDINPHNSSPKNATQPGASTN